MKEASKRKQLTGIVLNNKMDKTAKVLVERMARHKKYKKYLRYRKNYLVHDPHNKCKSGDKVRIIESRPISRLKRWRIFEVID